MQVSTLRLDSLPFSRLVESRWKKSLWPYCLPILRNHTFSRPPKRKLSFCLSAPPSVLLLAVTVSPVSAAVAAGDQLRRHRCGTSPSPYGSQPWCRGVAVFCSENGRELGSHCDGRDFMFYSPFTIRPSLPPSLSPLHPTFLPPSATAAAH